MEVVSYCTIMDFRWKLFRIALSWKRLELDFKSDFAFNGRIFGFFVRK